MARFGCVLDERSETRGQRPRYAQRPILGRQVSPDPDQPVTEAIMETSSSSAGVSGGRMVASRAASIDLPAPGGPTINMLSPQCQRRCTPGIEAWGLFRKPMAARSGDT